MHLRVWDNHGRASFAILALVVLLLANISVAYIFEVEREEAAMGIQSDEIRAMRECSEIVNEEVEVAAHYIAMAAIKSATQEIHNHTKINELFSAMFDKFVVESFPRETRGFAVSIDNHDIVVVTERQRVKEVVAVASISNENPNNDFSDIIKTGEPGAMEKIERIAYYRIIGQVNYTFSRGKTVLRTSERFASNIDSPFPFLNSQLGRFHIATDGSMSHTAQALKYILTTVAQHRVLLGYAGGEYGRPGTGISGILTPEDIEMAVNLVLVLEQLRLFRATDSEAVTAFDRAYFTEYAGGIAQPLVPAASNRTLVRLLDTYAGKGTIDPADLFVLFTAMDKDDLPVNKVVAQALYAIIDQYALKYLDYLNFLPLEFLANLGLGVVELFTNAFNDFVDWLTDHQREADLVREFVRNLFEDLGYSATILGPVSVSLPVQTFLVANEDGAQFNVSIPAQHFPVPFKTSPLLDGSNGIWSAYFDKIYKIDMKTLHDGVRDLARDIARKIANDLELVGLFQPIRLNGFIEPKDKVAMLEYLDVAIKKSLRTAMEDMNGNPQFYVKLAENLWEKEKATVRGLVNYIEEAYELIVNPLPVILFARQSLTSSIFSVSSSDSDFPFLDSSAKKQLEGMILENVIGNGWDSLAFEEAKRNDFQRFENLYSKAVGLDIPPENGGMYRRMMEMVLGTSGLLGEVGRFLEVFLYGLMRNEHIGNDKILFPADKGPFEFGNPGLIDNGSGDGSRKESLVVDQMPDLLAISKLTSEGHEPTQEPVDGELFVDIMRPNAIRPSADSPNIHYTQVDSISSRPYETQWKISLKGSVKMKIETSRAVYIDPNGLIPVVDEITVPLNATIYVKTFSGWPLLGVDYANSNTLGGDLWELIKSFLQEAWDAVSSAFGWILEGARFLLDQTSGILDYLISQATKVLKFIYDVVNKVFDIIRNALKGLISTLLEALDFILEKLPSFSFRLSLFGFTIRIAVNIDAGTRLLLEATLGSFSLAAKFVNLEEAGITPLQNWTKWDVFADFGGRLGPFSLDGCIDPLMVVSDRLLRLKARWSDTFVLDLVAPEVETYRVYGFGIVVPIPVPPAETIDIGLGFRIRTSGPINLMDIGAMIAASLDEALRDCGGISLLLDRIIVCAAFFVKDFLTNLLSIMDTVLRKIIDVTFYVDAGIMLGSVAGIGGSVSITLEGEGLIELIEFAADNIDDLINCVFGDCDLRMEDAPKDIPSHLFLTAGVFIGIEPPTFIPLTIPGGGSIKLSVDFSIGANMALLGALIGSDLGPWRIEFGMVIEDLPTSWLPAILDPNAERFDLWVFKGTVAAP